MYHEAAKKNGQYFRGFYPPQKAFFPTPGSSLSFTKIAATLQKLRLLSNSRVAYDHRTQLKSFTKIEEHFIYTPWVQFEFYKNCGYFTKIVATF